MFMGLLNAVAYFIVIGSALFAVALVTAVLGGLAGRALSRIWPRRERRRYVLGGSKRTGVV
jgi:hypothetical protein